jgi:hypothetical protein
LVVVIGFKVEVAVEARLVVEASEVVVDDVVAGAWVVVVVVVSSFIFV